MYDCLYIDDIDVYEAFGAFIVGSPKDVVCFHPMKAVKSNDWGEDDGVEPDLDDLSYRVDARNITLTFGFRGKQKDLPGFLEMLAGEAYHTFRFNTFGKSLYAPAFNLRFVGASSIDDLCDGRLGSLKLKFSCDAYEVPSINGEITGSRIPASDEYRLKGVRLSDFNVTALKGTLNSIRKPSDVKQRLTFKSATADGLIYDAQGEVMFKEREAKMNCLLRADNVDDFWLFHRGLFALLRLNHLHTLYVEANDMEYDAYYKSCSVSSFGFDGRRVWMGFTLTFALTGNLREVLSGNLLATEEGDYIVTEEEEAFIDMLID